MIPGLVSIVGAPWDVLPPGIHMATLAEVELTFAINQRRQTLFGGLLVACASLRSAGCSRIFLDGGYDHDF